VTDGSQPPICHIHRSQANGNPFNGGRLKTPPDLDPVEVLRRDLRSGEASVRVRAATELLSEERRRRAERQEIDADDQAWVVFKAAVLPDEVRELNGLANRIRLIKAQVYQRCPDARPASYNAPTRVATNDYAPGTLYSFGCVVCEAVALDVPPVGVVPPPVVLEDDDLLDGEEEV
jgi:hypothetical protein